MAKALISVSCLILSLSAGACEVNGMATNTMTTKAIGTAEMSVDGTLTIRMYDAPEGADTQIIKPTDPYYFETIRSVGSIKRGEKKFIMPSVGQVTMNADGSISFILVAHTGSGEQVGTRGTANPGDKNYKSLLHRVGGLNPGETKLIPPE